MKAISESHHICHCGRSYKYKENLSRHLRQECGKEPKFLCHLCPYKAKQKTTLQTHMRCIHPLNDAELLRHTERFNTDSYHHKTV